MHQGFAPQRSSQLNIHYLTFVTQLNFPWQLGKGCGKVSRAPPRGCLKKVNIHGLTFVTQIFALKSLQGFCKHQRLVKFGLMPLLLRILCRPL